MQYTEKCKNSSQKSSLNSINFSFANKNSIQVYLRINSKFKIILLENNIFKIEQSRPA